MSTWGEVKEFADPSVTLCDYDGQLPAGLRVRVRMLRRRIQARPLRIRLDRTARGFHMIIKWSREFSPAETVALQAILGSDPFREILNLARTSSIGQGKLQARYWNILYARKHEVR